MGAERRDFKRRAETMRRVAARLLSESQGLLSSAFENDGTVQPRAAERILKRLAIRGLVRRLEDRWAPTDVFLHAMPLEGCAAA